MSNFKNKKMKIKNTIAVIVLAMLSFSSMSAQIKQEFSVYGAGGLSTLDYKVQGVNVEESKRAGYSFGVGYSYFLTEKWGLNTGLEFSTYMGKAELQSISDQFDAVDDELENFVYKYTVGGYEEKQRVSYLNIPLMVQFQTSVDDGFYVALGGKIGLPVVKRYTSNMSSIATQGYYPSTDVTYDDFLYRGFGKFSDRSNKGDLDLKVAFMLSAEAGVKSRLNDKLCLYTGVYVDYSLNNVAKDGERFLSYDASHSTAFNNKSILNSQYLNDKEQSNFVNKVRPLAIGVKVRLAFGK